MKKDISRRDFLKYAGAGVLGLVANSALGKGARGVHRVLGEPSDVVQCYSADAVDNQGNINQAVAQAMMDASITTLTGIGSVGAAWKSLFPGISPSSVIGIKVCCATRYCPSWPETVETIANGLVRMDLGGSNFKRNNIITWERTDVELTRAGYSIYDGSDPDTMRCFGTDHSGVGYDYNAPLDMNGYTVHPSKILSQMCDYIISLAVLKDHSTAKVTLTMKNHYGSVYNIGVTQTHLNQCNPYIPALNQQIRDVLTPNDKQRIFIIDGLLGIYNGGPGGSPNFLPEMYIMSRDTVACDFQGQVVINEERVRQGYQPLDARHITTAAQPPYELGTTDINLIQIGPTGMQEPGRRSPVNAGLSVAPDPFRRSTVVAFSLRFSERVTLQLVDRSGRVAADLFDGTLGRGRHEVKVNTGTRLQAGTYLLRLSGSNGDRTRKVTVLN